MKKINSNGYGHRFLLLAALFLAGIPACLAILRWALPGADIGAWILASRIVGGGILLSLAILLLIEFRQDRRLAKAHEKTRRSRAPLRGGGCECQACGNRRVTERDAACALCGTRFESL